MIAEFGAPVLSEYRDGTRVEIYTFQQGYSKWVKVGRAFGHGVAKMWLQSAFGKYLGLRQKHILMVKKLHMKVSYGPDDLVKAIS